MEKLIPIKGFPMYRLVMDTLKIVSFHKDPINGKYRSLEMNDRCQYGYHLYNNGKKKFFTLDMLKGEVELFKLKELMNAMWPDTKKTSTSGVVATGDWIVGSINKNSGVFSTTSTPAKHLTRESARTEAARLASLDKTKKFVVLKIDSIASANEINWE